MSLLGVKVTGGRPRGRGKDEEEEGGEAGRLVGWFGVREREQKLVWC
jgi:hypothetical protein